MTSIQGISKFSGVASIKIVPNFGYDIFLIAGQSNTLYGLPNSADTIPDTGGLDSTDSDIKQLGRFSPNTDIVMDGSEPLEHNTSHRLGHVGWALAFAKWYKENILVSGRKILLVPCGVGATSFSGNHWNEGDVQYEDLVARANTAKSIGSSSNTIKALLWHQGESDTASLTGTAYKTAWKAMVSALETDISETNLVCVVGGLHPYGIANTAGYSTINTALSQLPAERLLTGYASTSSPTTFTNEAGTGAPDIHFTARTMRGYPTQDFSDISTIGLAGRYATAYLSALENT